MHCLLLFVVPFLLYIQTFSFDYSYHDDDTIVLYNAKSLHDFDMKKIFLTDAWMMNKQIELYRPWQSFTYAIDYIFTGSSAKGYHVHNVIIYCISILLFYFFLLSLNIGEQNSFLLSLIYSVHFLLAHVVSWLPARGDLYLFAFSISCMLFFRKYLRTKKIIFVLLSSLFYFLALLSKESALVLLPILYAVAFLFWKIEWKKPGNYFLLIPSTMLTLLYFWMRLQSISASQNIFSIEGLIYNLRVIPEEVCKFFIPAFFSVMPAYSTTVTSIGVGLIILLCSLLFVFRKTINRNLVLAGGILFLVPLLPSLIYTPSFTGFAYDYLDHRMFFPGIGILLIAYSISILIIRKILKIF